MAVSQVLGHPRYVRSTQLRRNPTNGRIAGVASGLSDFFGIDATLVRALFVLATVFTGVGALIYVLCWIIIPIAATPGSSPKRPQRRGLVWAIVVFALIIGTWNAISDNRALFIAIVILILAAFVWRRIRRRGSWKAHKEFAKARLAWQRRLDEQANQAAPPTNLGGDPFQIDSFYPAPPPNPDDDNPNNPNSGFQIQQ